MRTLILTTLALALAATCLAGAASADPFVVGNCQKNGACAGGCVSLTTPCWDHNLLCVGISYQVPFCVHDPGLVVSPSLPDVCVTQVYSTRGDAGACGGLACIGYAEGEGWLKCYGHPIPPCVNICV
jgi:hypothetical protein